MGCHKPVPGVDKIEDVPKKKRVGASWSDLLHPGRQTPQQKTVRFHLPEFTFTLVGYQRAEWRNGLNEIL